MPRLKMLGAMALVTAVSCFQARAAAPALPPDAIAPDTVAVIHLNAGHFNPELIQSAARAVLGNNASKVDEPLKKFKAKYAKAADAGAEAVTLVMGSTSKVEKADAGADGKEAGNAVAYIHLKDGADVKALEAMIAEDMKPEEKAKTTFDQVGHFLAVHQKDQPLPGKSDAARATLFSDALGTISDASVQIAFIPDAKTRAEMLKNAGDAPKGLKDTAPLLAKSKWMTLAINFGNAPSLAGSANMASEEDAKTLTESITTGLADAKAQAANPGPNAGLMAIAGPLIGQLIDGLKPTSAGSNVTMTLKTDSLKQIANFAASLGVLGGPAGEAPKE